MIQWIPLTFVRTVSVFILGIVAGILFDDALFPLIAPGMLVLLIVAYLVLFLATGARRVSYGFIALPAVFIAGYVHVYFQTESKSDDHLLAVADSVSCYRVTIISYAEEKQNTWKMIGQVSVVRTGERWRKAHGKVLLYFRKDDFARHPDYGDVLIVRGKPSPTKPPGNPGMFDYGRFLSYRNVYHVHHIRSGGALIVGEDVPNRLMHAALGARLWSNDILRSYVPGEKEHGVAAALILGATDWLDDDLLAAYSASGTMHVLAVSGLHISILYMIIAWMLKPLTRTIRGKWIVAAISLFVLWTYAFVTGLSPSVLRAVTMFTFVVVASATGRTTNIYNTMAASAFCLLLFDPFLVTSVGFQLSYLAVLGILYIHPMLYAQWIPDSRLVNEIWKVSSVSIAAQVATVPLTLLYFHQFPNYFIISNLIVIPLSFVVLVGGLLLLALGFVPVVASVVGLVLGWVIRLMNLCVVGVGSLPFSVIDNIHVTATQCFLLMALVVTILILIRARRFYHVVVAAALTFAYAACQWLHFWVSSTPSLVVYQVQGHSAIEFIHNGRATFISDTALIADAGKIRFNIEPNRLVAGVRETSVNALSGNIPGGTLIRRYGTTLLLVTERDFLPVLCPEVDVVIVAKNSVIELARIAEACPQALIVFDSSNSYYYVERMIRKHPGLESRMYSVPHQGAFIHKLKSDA